jgi:hypothetical protein
MVSITISTATKSYQGTDARCDKKEISPLFEIARVLVRVDHVARFNQNGSREVQRVPQPCCLKVERGRLLFRPRSL